MEAVTQKGAMTFFEYGIVGVLLLAALLALTYIVKKLVLDQGKNTHELSKLISTLVVRIEARDDLLLKTVEDVYHQRDKCQEELAHRLAEHHSETTDAIGEIHDIVVQLRDGVGCALPQRKATV